MQQNSDNLKDVIYCSLWRRLGAIVYDGILLVCVIFIAWQPVPLLPETLPEIFSRVIRLGYLVLICFLFFGWFWCHGGQTLGMRAWKIKLVNSTSLGAVTWRRAWRRFLMALLSWFTLGCGFLFSIFHPKNQTWHDSFSGTSIVLTKQSSQF